MRVIGSLAFANGCGPMLEIERAIEDLSSAGRFILEELVDNGFAVLHDGWFRLSFLDVWSFEAATRDALGLSTLYGMQLEVVVRGVLGQVGTSFELRLESELGRHTEQALEGGLIRWADDVFLLPKGVGIAQYILSIGLALELIRFFPSNSPVVG